MSPLKGIRRGPVRGRRPTPRTVCNVARTRLLNASGPTQGNVVRIRSCPSADRSAARLYVAAVQSRTICARDLYMSAMIQFRALAGPVLKHGPRSLACVRVIEYILSIKLKGVTKVKADVRRPLREDGAPVSIGVLALPRRLVSNP